MAKRKRLFTEASALKLWKEGRGQGEGSDYKPWLYIHDVASKGLVTRIQGWKHQREHHLLSNGEFAYFYQLEWSEQVVDIREQFPLWPIEETQEIAGRLGIKHPDPRRGENNIAVVTSDMRITTAILFSPRRGSGCSIPSRSAISWVSSIGHNGNCSRISTTCSDHSSW